MSFKDFSYLEVCWPFYSAEQNHLRNFGRSHHEEQFYEIISIGPVVQEEMLLTDIFIWSSGGTFVQWCKTICAILVEGIMRNNSVNLFQIMASGSGGDVVYLISYLEL